MKKLILLLLISGGLSAQVVVPKSTTTFSNVNAVGSMTVGGNLRVTGSETITGAATLSSSTTIGTGTVAANTSSLGIVRIKQGSSFWDFGDYGSGYAGIWANQSAPTTTNYAIASSTASLEFLNPTGINMNIAGTTKFYVSSGYCYARNLLKVGSNTAPSATLDVTGTMSVSSTATITGAAKLTNTLNYVGNTTWNTNQTNTLTTGNTGTVAVLSDAVFPVYITGGAGTPADGATYYIGGVFVGYWWNSNTNKITLPYNCTLVRWDYNWIGTPGTGEAATISINGTTNYTLSSAITFSNAAASETYSGSGLSQNFNAGDSFNIKMVCPTWVTNPTGLYTGITLWFVRRQ